LPPPATSPAVAPADPRPRATRAPPAIDAGVPPATPSLRRSGSRPLVGESVADAVHREQVARRPRVWLELAPDVLDVGVDGPLVRLERHAGDRGEQLRPREDPARLGSERR